MPKEAVRYFVASRRKPATSRSQGAVRGDQRFHDGDEVEEHAAQRRWVGKVSPARAVIERRGQHRERGNAV